MSEERFLSASELMTRYGLSRFCFYKWVAQGKFPQGCHFGRARRWPLSQLQKWESERMEEAVSA